MVDKRCFEDQPSTHHTHNKTLCFFATKLPIVKVAYDQPNQQCFSTFYLSTFNIHNPIRTTNYFIICFSFQVHTWQTLKTLNSVSVPHSHIIITIFFL